MKAIVQDAYGSPDVLKLTDIDKPVTKDDDVMVRVRAAAIHAGDYFCMRGTPFAVRAVTGLLKPRSNYVPGFDVAGQVEVVGKNVTRLQLGDEVGSHLVGWDALWTLHKELACSTTPSAGRPL